MVAVTGLYTFDKAHASEMGRLDNVNGLKVVTIQASHSRTGALYGGEDHAAVAIRAVKINR